MKKCVCCLFSLALLWGGAAAGDEKGAGHIRLADGFLAAGDPLRAAINYRLAINEGALIPEVFRNLAEALYGLRLLDDAVASMEEAVRLEPDDLPALLKLGTFYVAAGRWQQAVDSLALGLEKNPANGAVYFYLGEALFRQKSYDLAWLAARTALKLRFDSSMLVDKLWKAGAREPKGPFFSDPGKKIAISKLVLKKQEDVQTFWSQWEQGASFASLTLQLGEESEKAMGGYIGTFSAEDLRPSLREALAGREPYHRPVAVATGEGALMVQRVLPFSLARWQQLLGGKPSPPVEAAETERGSPRRADASPAGEGGLELTGLDQRKRAIYAGTFSILENATDLVRRLRSSDFDAAFLRKRKKNGGELYYVIAGQYDSDEEVAKASERLRREGYESFSPGR